MFGGKFWLSRDIIAGELFTFSSETHELCPPIISRLHLHSNTMWSKSSRANIVRLECLIKLLGETRADSWLAFITCVNTKNEEAWLGDVYASDDIVKKRFSFSKKKVCPLHSSIIHESISKASSSKKKNKTLWIINQFTASGSVLTKPLMCESLSKQERRSSVECVWSENCLATYLLHYLSEFWSPARRANYTQSTSLVDLICH